MSDQEVRQHVTQWIENTLSKPSPHFNNLPPCPYSHSALVKSKVDVRHASGAGLLPALASIAESWDDSHEVMIVMCDKTAISPNELIEGVTQLSESFKNRDLLVNCDHPDCVDTRFKVTSTNGKYAMGAVQRLGGFLDGARSLFKKGYYKNVQYADLSHYTSFQGNFDSAEEWIAHLANVQFHDRRSGEDSLLRELVDGLKHSPKALPAKINYFKEGADLYEQVCQTPEYYLTRVELSIMEQSIQEIAACFPGETVLIEPGSGNCQKTRLLFDNLPGLTAYVPIDVSKEQLLGTAAQIAYEYDHLEVLPVCADYTQCFDLPVRAKDSRKLIYYPGSTICNQDPQSAILFLKQLRALCKPGDALLIGIDLKKHPAVLQLAYADPEGANERFIQNPLKVLRRDHGVEFDLSNYQHHVTWNEQASRVEISMRCLKDHVLSLHGEEIEFTEGELVERAVSYKYTQETFQSMVEQAGWQTEQVWADQQKWFSVNYLAPAP